MDRLACVNLIDLPLQLLLRRNPNWQEGAVVVVDRDQPNGVVQWVNKYARRSKIVPGMRYAEALSLEHALRAGTVTPAEIDASIEAVAERLLDYTPFVEAADGEPGIFWLDAGGLDRLFGSFERWGQAVAEELLEREGFYTTIVVGFSRFGTWAIARARRGGLVVYAEPADEDRIVRRVPLGRLHIDPTLRDELAKLGIQTLADFLELPSDGVRRRFGDLAWQLHRRARGELAMPLTPIELDKPPEERLDLDAPETVSTRLVFLIKRYLHPLLAQLERRQDKLERLDLVFIYERAVGVERFAVRPAEPTVDEGQILDLLRLRLEQLDLQAGVVEVEMTAQTTRARQEQLRMFIADKKRDLRAANRALARVRAEFGEESVVRAQLRDAHLPEASYSWEPLHRFDEPHPDPVEVRPLVRRIRRRPEPITHAGFERDEVEMAGPFVISGGWWLGGVHRNYHFAETDDGEIVWVYWDAARGRWFRQGSFE